VDSATPGKPFVQNDTGLRAEHGTVDVAAQDKPSVQNDMGGEVKVKEESGSCKYAVKNYTRKSAFVRCSTRESIKSQYSEHQ